MVISGSDSDFYRVVAPQDLGAALRYFREQAGATQRHLADEEGVTQPYVSALEAGDFGGSVGHVLRLLRLVGCEVIVRPRSDRGA